MVKTRKRLTKLKDASVMDGEFMQRDPKQDAYLHPYTYIKEMILCDATQQYFPLLGSQNPKVKQIYDEIESLATCLGVDSRVNIAKAIATANHYLSQLSAPDNSRGKHSRVTYEDIIKAADALNDLLTNKITPRAHDKLAARWFGPVTIDKIDGTPGRSHIGIFAGKQKLTGLRNDLTRLSQIAAEEKSKIPSAVRDEGLMNFLEDLVFVMARNIFVELTGRDPKIKHDRTEVKFSKTSYIIEHEFLNFLIELLRLVGPAKSNFLRNLPKEITKGWATSNSSKVAQFGRRIEKLRDRNWPIGLE